MSTTTIALMKTGLVVAIGATLAAYANERLNRAPHAAASAPTARAVAGGVASHSRQGAAGTPRHSQVQPVLRAGTLAITNVELAQSHVLPPQGLEMQTEKDKAANQKKRLSLLSNRPALLMVRSDTPSGSLQVRARLTDGQVLGPLALQAPAQLPKSDDGGAAYATDKFSVTLPDTWIQIGAVLELSASNFSDAPVRIPIKVEPGTTMDLYTVPYYLWGARPQESQIKEFRLSKYATNGYRVDYEFAEKLPMSKLTHRVGPSVIMDKFATPPRNDAAYCHPAMTIDSEQAAQDAGFEMVWRLYDRQRDLFQRTATEDFLFNTGYYGYIQFKHTNGAQQPDAGVALGGDGTTMVSGDWADPSRIYSAVFNHELGHAWGMPHAGDEGALPYPFARKAGSAWGYDSNRNELLTTRQVPGRDCGNPPQLVDGVCYQATPMSGGDHDRMREKYRFTTFADYEAARAQDWALSKWQPNESSTGGYRRWNRDTQSFQDMDGVTASRKASWVLKRHQKVYTVFGTVSHHNKSPTATRLYLSNGWVGNLPRHYNPSKQADLDLMQRPDADGGDNGYFCRDRGCDYSLMVTYNNGTSIKVLLPIGYRTYGGGLVKDATAADSLDGRNFQSYAVNIPSGRGGVRKLQLFSTPFGTLTMGAANPKSIPARLLGSEQYPLINEWTPADGYGGGSGAPGQTEFNTNHCQPGAKQIVPRA